jgi:hypothetical protein
VGFVKLCWVFGAGIYPATIYIVTHGCTKLPRLLFILGEKICRGLVWLVLKVSLFIPRHLAPPVRYRSRYWRRSRQKQTGLPTHELRLWTVSPSDEKHISIEISSKSLASRRSTIIVPQFPPLDLPLFPLLKFLSRESNTPILLEIISYLHYTDVITLSLLSKRVRSELFGSSSQVEALRVASCIPAKIACYCCNTQICAVRNTCTSENHPLHFRERPLTSRTQSCQTSRSLPPTDTHRHLHTCVIHCSACYRAKICAPRAIHSPPICACGSSSSNLSTALSSRTRTTTTTAVATTNPRNICHFCSARPDGGLAIRTLRDKSEITHLAGQELKCGECKRRLPSRGVRWWVCGGCNRECTSRVHPQWSKGT